MQRSLLLLLSLATVVLSQVRAAPPSDGTDGVVRSGTRPIRTPPPEREDQPPADVRFQPREEGPRKIALRGPFVSVQVNVNAMGNNIVGDAANETSIAVNPMDRSKMAIGWRQFDSVASSFREAGRAYTTDGGATWTFPGVLDNGLFRSDPVLDSDANGVFYYSSLRNTSPFTAQIFKSADSGVTWGAAVPASGGDKQWLAVDDRPAGMGAGHIYHNWNIQFSCCGATDFTRSINGGASYQAPMLIPPPSMKWGASDVGPDGTLYIAGSTLNQDGHLVTRSSNAKDPAVTPSFDFVTSVDLGGLTGGFGGSDPNPGGLLGQVWVAADPSNANRVYMLGSVIPPSGNPMNVMFARSIDRAQTWSQPVRVNDDPTSGGFHWFGTMSVAPNGRIDVVWNDTRNTGAANLSETYYAYSVDSGFTWSANVSMTPVWNSHVGWPQQNKIGDYYHMVSDNSGASLAYAATFNGEQDVYFLRIMADCNNNGVPDDQDVALGAPDCNDNEIPDVCEPDADCNNNGMQDICDIAAGSSDCNLNLVPDSCEEADCDDNGEADVCQIAAGEPDCNANSILDSCDIADGTSLDTNGNQIPDECEGACCQCDGACSLTTAASCSALFGFFQGVGSSCDDVVCGAPNDFCSSRTILPSYPSQSVNFDTSCASSDGPTTIECGGSQPIGTDIWYQYVAPCTGTVRASLCGATMYDSLLAVYGGGTVCSCTVNSTSHIACGDDTCGIGGGPSLVTFNAIAGRCYLIRVAGWNFAAGTGALQISYDTACDVTPPTVTWLPDDAANRSIRVQVEPSVVAAAAGTAAIKVTMVDLQHPFPKNKLCCPPPDFSAFDTRLNGRCSGGSISGHPCDTDADCRACGVFGAPCTSDADCRLCNNDISVVCNDDGDCASVGGACSSSSVTCPASGGTCVNQNGCSAEAGPLGCARWVGPPQTFLESNDLPGAGSFRGARLQCAPHYRDWTAEGPFSIFGAEIIPSSEYDIQAYSFVCDGTEETCPFTSSPLAATTRRWADVAVLFSPPSITSQPDALDVAAVVNKFKGLPGAPAKALALLQPNAAEPNNDVTALDIAATPDAFKGFAYPYRGPCVCPSEVPCEVTPCANASACTGLYGAGATCVKSCAGGPNAGQPCNNDKNCNYCTGGGLDGLPCDPNASPATNPCNTAGGVCPTVSTCGSGFCRDACGRCN